MKSIIKIIIRIILSPRLIKHKFFNNKNKINTNNISSNKKSKKAERNKYGFPCYDEVKKMLK